MDDSDKQPTAAVQGMVETAAVQVAPMEAAEDIQMTTEKSSTPTLQAVNGHSKTPEPVVSIEEEDTANDVNLSPPPESMSSGPINAAEDEIVVGTTKSNSHHLSPARETSADDDVEMGDSDGNKPSATPYPKRKRVSLYNQLDDDNLDNTINYDDSAMTTPGGNKVQVHGTTGATGIPVGYWRESKAVNEADKHLCVAFIDTRDRLRTRLQKTTRDGRPVPKESIPVGPGGSWVTFDRIVFDEHLVGLDHNEIKEYTKIRPMQMAAGETEEQEAQNMKAAVAEAKRRVQENPPPETPNGTQVAYGKEIPEYAIVTRPDNKRRRLFPPSGTIPQTPPDTTVARAATVPVVASSASRYPLDPLNGTRPTKILLGYWNHSSEESVADKHAVFGILGANDMFRVKVTRESRDGRTVIGNFPTGAGALWINYDDVILEAHLAQLSRAEVKEYTRVRQRQLDEGETPAQRVQNETTAVFEAQRRVGVQQLGGEIRPPPPAILPTATGTNGAFADTADDPDFTINSVRPKRVLTAEPTANMGLPAHQPNRPELRQRARAFPAQGATQPISRGVNNNNDMENRATTSRGPVPTAAASPAITRDVQLSSQQQQVQKPFPPNQHAERTVAMAQGGIDRMEQAHMRTRQREASSRDSTPRGGFIADIANANINASHGLPTNGGGMPNNIRGNTAQTSLQRLQGVWAEQETNRVRATGSENEKVYNGVKYERKQTGPFAGKLTSQGNIITIDGVDYVEYRILMVPSFS